MTAIRNINVEKNTPIPLLDVPVARTSPSSWAAWVMTWTTTPSSTASSRNTPPCTVLKVCTRAGGNYRILCQIWINLNMMKYNHCFDYFLFFFFSNGKYQINVLQFKVGILVHFVKCHFDVAILWFEFKKYIFLEHDFNGNVAICLPIYLEIKCV